LYCISSDKKNLVVVVLLLNGSFCEVVLWRKELHGEQEHSQGDGGYNPTIGRKKEKLFAVT